MQRSQKFQHAVSTVGVVLGSLAVACHIAEELVAHKVLRLVFGFRNAYFLRTKLIQRSCAIIHVAGDAPD